MTLALNFWVDIEDASGNKIGAGPLRPQRFDEGKPLSKAAEFSFPVSPADPNLGAIEEKLFAICRYLDTDGVEQIFGGGIIDRIDKSYTFSKTNFIISGPNLTGELVYRSVLDLQIGDETGGDDDAPDQIMAFAPSGWSITGGITDQDVYVRFDGQSVLNSLVSVSEAIGEHFRLGSGREIEWIGPYTGFSASGVRAIGGVPIGNDAIDSPEITIIKRLKELTDSHELVTRVYPRGAGTGNAILRLLAVTDAAPAGFTLNASAGYIEKDSSVSTYGNIEREVDFKNISPLSNSSADKNQAANQLMRAAVELLNRWAEPQKFYEIQLAKSEVILEPGTTIRVIFKQTINDVDIMDIDDTFNIIDVSNRLSTNGIYTQSIMISTTDTQPMNDNELVVSQLLSARAVSTHAQMNANARWLRTQGAMDDSNDLTVPFWLGAEVVSINSCILRFQINPLRSTTTAAASGGGATSGSGGDATSGSGGASTPTSTNTNPVHTHNLDFVAGVPGHTMGFLSGSTFGTNPSQPGPGVVRTSNNASASHNHDVSVPNHTHSTSVHNHSTPNHSHSLTYGIFEESGGNTLGIGDITITINGGSLTNSPASIGGGWFEVDITVDIVDGIFSPDQEDNEIVYSTAVSKTASIITDISLVDVVQGVSIV